MKKITFLLLVLTSSFIYSQDCKYSKNEIDEFTNNKVLETKYEDLAANVGYNFKKVNDQKYIRIEIHLNKVFAIAEDSKLMLLTDSEEPIELIFPKHEISRVQSLYDMYIVQHINLNDVSLQRLKDEKIRKLRFYTTDGYVDREVKEKRSNKFREILRCIE